MVFLGSVRQCGAVAAPKVQAIAIYVVFFSISDGQARAGVAVFLSEKMSKFVKG